MDESLVQQIMSTIQSMHGSDFHGAEFACEEGEDEVVVDKNHIEHPEFVSDGETVIFLKFVHNENQMESAVGYHPLFVYQHFGQSEKIFGYKGLKVVVYYTDATAFIFCSVAYKSCIKPVKNVVKFHLSFIHWLAKGLPFDYFPVVTKTNEAHFDALVYQVFSRKWRKGVWQLCIMLQRMDRIHSGFTRPSLVLYINLAYFVNIIVTLADNIMKKLRTQLPSTQMSAMVNSIEHFHVKLREQEKFAPFGELSSAFDCDGRHIGVYKVEEGSNAFDAYLARVQTLALWFIEGSVYTDNDDYRWNHYFMYETVKRCDDVGDRYSLAGYVSLMNFYCHPHMIRVRIAQFLVLPQYRSKGMGSKFLQAIYNDIVLRKEVKDITAEDPVDKFTLMRDFVDCRNCACLPEFSVKNIKQCFSNEMVEAAQRKLKLHSKQTRRVYDILHLMHVRGEEELKEYRLDVKRRLELPFQKSRRDWCRLKRGLSKEEMAAVIVNQNNIDKKIETLQTLYESEVKDYRTVIHRLKVYADL